MAQDETVWVVATQDHRLFLSADMVTNEGEAIQGFAMAAAFDRYALQQLGGLLIGMTVSW